MRFILKIFPEKSMKHDSYFDFLRQPIHRHFSFIEFGVIYRSYLSGKRTSIRAYPLDPRDLTGSKMTEIVLTGLYNLKPNKRQTYN